MGIFSGIHNQQVTIALWSTESASGWKGQASYGTPKSFLGRVDWSQRRVLGADARSMVSSGRVIYDGDLTAVLGRAPDVRDKLTLPDGRQPAIISVESTAGLFGAVTCTVLNF